MKAKVIPSCVGSYVMLSDFYRSRDWYNLMQMIKLERINDDGHLICEHCHQPIVKAYDCIGHHVIELTEANYTNADISLNPDNIVLVHHKCHNRIHDKLNYMGRQVYIVYGSPLAGKTTYVKDNMRVGDIVVDIDSIWQCISGCDRYIKPNGLKSNVFDIRNTLIDSIRMRKGFWHTAWIIGGYPLISERERLCRTLNAKEIFIDTPKEECIKRAYECDRPEDWLKYIEDWWEKFSPILPPPSR